MVYWAVGQILPHPFSIFAVFYFFTFPPFHCSLNSCLLQKFADAFLSCVRAFATPFQPPPTLSISLSLPSAIHYGCSARVCIFIIVLSLIIFYYTLLLSIYFCLVSFSCLRFVASNMFLPFSACFIIWRRHHTYTQHHHHRPSSTSFLPHINSSRLYAYVRFYSICAIQACCCLMRCTGTIHAQQNA